MRIWRNPLEVTASWTLFRPMKLSVPFLGFGSYVKTILQSLDSLKASNINLCFVSSSLVSKDLSTGATASSYDSIFVCNPKLLLLTLALLAKKTHKYSWIKVHQEMTSNRVSSDPHVHCHVPNQVHIPVNFAVYFSYSSKWQDIT